MITRGPDCGGLPPNTKMPPCGTTYKMVFSKDPQQKYMYVADGTNDLVWIIERKTGKTVSSIGGNGKYAGQFHWINAIGIDSKGNIYTGEVEQAKRIQKFVPGKPDNSQYGGRAECVKVKGAYTGKDGRFVLPAEKLDGLVANRLLAIKPDYENAVPL